MKKPVTITLIVIVVIMVCCCIAAIVLGTTYGVFNLLKASPTGEAPTSQADPFNTEETSEPVVLPTPLPATSDDLKSADKMLSNLENVIVPINNYYDLGTRLLGKKDVPLTLPAPMIAPALNDKQEFWVSNTDSHDTFKINAQLKYISAHLYFWVEDGVKYNDRDLKKLADTFEQKIYPTDREFFGSEWTPGVDNDPHLYIVLGKSLGNDLAGYFSSSDEYNPEIHEYSNAHEMFLLNGDNVDLSDEFTYGVLAHEFQHMIHWYRDLNEETWMNEGFSELAALLNGYDVGGFDYAYVSNPDLQLTDWSSGVGDNTAHYGASFLFVSYFLDRFGEDATKAVVASPDNGMVSIDKVLKDLNEVDKQTGNVITANDFFSDWVVTNFINDGSVGDGRYRYKKYTGYSTPSPTETYSDCPVENTTATVHQYAADYIQVECSGKHTFSFKGQSLVPVLNVDANSGKYAFWSNKGDESDMTLTREFDFSNQSGPITMQYATWYDLEQDYDYSYVEVSEDGVNWTILHTPLGTDKDISGNSFGWGYNGTSDGWVNEEVDLSDYAGKKVQIRFEYVTDAAVNGEGMLVDDIQIPEMNYNEDFESGDGGWTGAGFVRSNNLLPQTYRVNLIEYQGNDITVTPVKLNADLSAEIPLDIKDGQRAVITISGTTPFTRQEAVYNYQIK